jgi:multimeric flavodoxin WrbA
VEEVLKEELTNAGWNTESILINQVDFKSCIGCFMCWDTTPGICRFDDPGRDIARKVIQSELVVFLTPLTFGGYSSVLKKIIERLLGLLLPQFTKIEGMTHHRKRYENYPSTLGIAVTEKRDEEEVQIFKQLIKHHSLNFHSPKQRAEVFLTGEDKGEIQGRMRRVIVEMEMTK